MGESSLLLLVTIQFDFDRGDDHCGPSDSHSGKSKFHTFHLYRGYRSLSVILLTYEKSRLLCP